MEITAVHTTGILYLKAILAVLLRLLEKYIRMYKVPWFCSLKAVYLKII